MTEIDIRNTESTGTVVTLITTTDDAEYISDLLEYAEYNGDVGAQFIRRLLRAGLGI